MFPVLPRMLYVSCWVMKCHVCDTVIVTGHEASFLQNSEYVLIILSHSSLFPTASTPTSTSTLICISLYMPSFSQALPWALHIPSEAGRLRFRFRFRLRFRYRLHFRFQIHSHFRFRFRFRFRFWPLFGLNDRRAHARPKIYVLRCSRFSRCWIGQIPRLISSRASTIISGVSWTVVCWVRERADSLAYHGDFFQWEDTTI